MITNIIFSENTLFTAKRHKGDYKISKFLLMQFICSPAVLIAAEGQTYMIVKMLRFLRGYVFDKEDTYLYFRRKLVMTMFTGHSSPHEVTTCYASLIMKS